MKAALLRDRIKRNQKRGQAVAKNAKGAKVTKRIVLEEEGLET